MYKILIFVLTFIGLFIIKSILYNCESKKKEKINPKQVRYGKKDSLIFKFLFIFNSFVLLYIGIFWKNGGIDKAFVMILFSLTDIILILVIIYFYKWLIELEDTYFIYHNIFRKKRIYSYDEIKIKTKNSGQTILLKNNKKVIAIPIFVNNQHLLVKQICKFHNPFI